MKKYSAILAALTLPFWFAACTEDESATVDDGYPLKVCVVSGEELGGMGDPVVIDYKGTKVKFCCDKCVEDFNKEPDKYLAKLKSN